MALDAADLISHRVQIRSAVISNILTVVKQLEKAQSFDSYYVADSSYIKLSFTLQEKTLGSTELDSELAYAVHDVWTNLSPSFQNCIYESTSGSAST